MCLSPSHLLLTAPAGPAAPGAIELSKDLPPISSTPLLIRSLAPPFLPRLRPGACEPEHLNQRSSHRVTLHSGQLEDMPGTRLRSLAPSGARPNGGSQRQAESCRHDGNVDVVQFTNTLSIISQVLDFISKPKARFIVHRVPRHHIQPTTLVDHALLSLQPVLHLTITNSNCRYLSEPVASELAPPDHRIRKIHSAKPISRAPSLSPSPPPFPAPIAARSSLCSRSGHQFYIRLLPLFKCNMNVSRTSSPNRSAILSRNSRRPSSVASFAAVGSQGRRSNGTPAGYRQSLSRPSTTGSTAAEGGSYAVAVLQSKGEWGPGKVNAVIAGNLIFVQVLV